MPINDLNPGKFQDHINDLLKKCETESKPANKKCKLNCDCKIQNIEEEIML